MLRTIRYHFWLRLSDLVEWLGLSEDTRLDCVVRAAQHIDYDEPNTEPEFCENCTARAPARWSEARDKGWRCSTGHDGGIHTLCPECQEPTERVQP